MCNLWFVADAVKQLLAEEAKTSQRCAVESANCCRVQIAPQYYGLGDLPLGVPYPLPEEVFISALDFQCYRTVLDNATVARERGGTLHPDGQSITFRTTYYFGVMYSKLFSLCFLLFLGFELHVLFSAPEEVHEILNSALANYRLMYSTPWPQESLFVPAFQCVGFLHHSAAVDWIRGRGFINFVPERDPQLRVPPVFHSAFKPWVVGSSLALGAGD